MQRLQKPGSLVRSYKGERSLRATYDVDDQPLGEGRYSRVFGATHRGTGTRRAIKTADRQGAWTQYVDLGMECPARLACHEADILRSLDHPNVIRILEVFDEKKAVHLVLELCEGGDVLERILISNGRLAESDIAMLFVQMLFGVWHLHLNGVVHRDLKPEHFLFMRREPEIEPRPPCQTSMKLIDFGLSHKAGVDFAPEGGTPQFMSPEAKAGRTSKDLADRADMWNMGVILHAMFMGHYPSPHLTDQKQSQYFARPAWSGISAGAIDLVGLLLRVMPAARPSAADALKHPWCKAAIGASVSAPEPLLRTAAAAIKSYTAAAGIRRLALAAMAREADDRDIIGLRGVLQTLELRCGGQLKRAALLRAAGSDGALGEAATALFRSFDSIVEKGGSEELMWTELVALFMCAGAVGKKGRVKATQGGPALVVRDETAWRAFDLLSYGTGSVSVASLDQLLLAPTGRNGTPASGKTGCAGQRSPGAEQGQGLDAFALNRLIREVFSSGTISYADFLRLARGDFQDGMGLITLVQRCVCSQCCSKAPDAAAPVSVRKTAPPPIALPGSGMPSPVGSPASALTTRSPQSWPPSPSYVTSEIGSPPSSPDKKKKRRPLSIMGSMSL